MKYEKANIIGDAGEYLLASRIIKLFGYPCRLYSIDIGIDAEIELIDCNYKSTGKFVKCQIKTTVDSSKTSLFIDKKHIKYWNSIDIPVVVFLVHLETEEIFWHCVDDVDSYKESTSGFKIEFNTNNTLKKENKEKFDEIALFPLIQQIRKIYEDAYEKVISDKSEFLDESNYDLTTAEFFVRNFFEIKFNLNKVEKLIHNNPPLQKIKQTFSKQLSLIYAYIRDVEEIVETIELDYGNDYFSFLKTDTLD